MYSIDHIMNLYGGLIIVALLVGFVPAFIAFARQHQYRWIILLLCLFGSWTGIVWLVALVWSAWPKNKSLIDPVVGNVTGTGSRNAGHTLGDAANGMSEQRRELEQPFEPYIPKNHTLQEPSERVCPFCAETIKSAAVICRYCKSDLQNAFQSPSSSSTQADIVGVSKSRSELTTDSGLIGLGGEVYSFKSDVNGNFTITDSFGFQKVFGSRAEAQSWFETNSVSHSIVQDTSDIKKK